MGKKKKQDSRIVILFIVGFFLFLGISQILSFVIWDPVQTGIITTLEESNITIWKIAKFRYGSWMFCGMCIPYRVEVKTFLNDTMICNGTNFRFTLREKKMPVEVKCPNLDDYVGKEVKIQAIGYIDNKFADENEKYMIVPGDIL